HSPDDRTSGDERADEDADDRVAAELRVDNRSDRRSGERRHWGADTGGPYGGGGGGVRTGGGEVLGTADDIAALDLLGTAESIDRKSTRLNSSHVSISYAVFCLTKKN